MFIDSYHLNNILLSKPFLMIQWKVVFECIFFDELFKGLSSSGNCDGSAMLDMCVNVNFKTGKDRYIRMVMAREHLIKWKINYPDDPSDDNLVFLSELLIPNPCSPEQDPHGHGKTGRNREAFHSSCNQALTDHSSDSAGGE